MISSATGKEALFLSDREESIIVDIFKNIEREYQSNIDKFTQELIIAQMELLLIYSERFYERQFLPGKNRAMNYSINLKKSFHSISTMEIFWKMESRL
jgi:hypothetical protein